MRVNQWLLFGHLIGVVVLFGAIAVENLTFVFMSRAKSVEDLRGATTFAPTLPVLFPVGAVLLLGFGIGLVAHSRRFEFGEAWIDISLGLVVVLMVLGPTVQGRRIDHITDAARSSGGGPIPADLAGRVRDPILRTSMLVSSWLAIGIVFLMARKPDWTAAWISVVIFGLIGVAESLLLSRLGSPSADGPALR